jgi:hypothetical protein
VIIPIDAVSYISYTYRMGEGEGFFSEWTESFDSFDEMNLHELLLRGIYAYGKYHF